MAKFKQGTPAGIPITSHPYIPSNRELRLCITVGLGLQEIGHHVSPGPDVSIADDGHVLEPATPAVRGAERPLTLQGALHLSHLIQHRRAVPGARPRPTHQVHPIPCVDGDKRSTAFAELSHQLHGFRHRVQQADLDEHGHADLGRGPPDHVEDQGAILRSQEVGTEVPRVRDALRAPKIEVDGIRPHFHCLDASRCHHLGIIGGEVGDHGVVLGVRLELARAVPRVRREHVRRHHGRVA
mmetsp:Transcript_30121/g.67525  ORF Transcript_30121/g.67525 Transcript_30121/m.67525 type:complete len:240 (+) Transcript_30121:515-1234(+)